MMKSYATLLAAAVVLILATPSSPAADDTWTHDFEAAKKQAATANKSLLIDFTGSDWCGWCMKLREEVFDHDAFKDGVRDAFVLVELDYPRDKSAMSEETIAQNDVLLKTYGVQGYPTILLTDAEGRPFGKTGYRQGGPEAYVEHLKELLKARTARDEAFARAASLSGASQAEALVAALQAMDIDDSLVTGLYGDTISKIKAADPKDASGFVSRMALNERFAEVESQLSNLLRQGDQTEAALKLANDVLAEDVFAGEQKQTILLLKGLVLGSGDRTEDALAVLDEAANVDPDSPLMRSIAFYRERYQNSEKPAEP